MTVDGADPTKRGPRGEHPAGGRAGRDDRADALSADARAIARAIVDAIRSASRRTD